MTVSSASEYSATLPVTQYAAAFMASTAILTPRLPQATLIARSIGSPLPWLGALRQSKPPGGRGALYDLARQHCQPKWPQLRSGRPMVRDQAYVAFGHPSPIARSERPPCPRR